MKVRNGFVSNSSSSSFMCDVCGTTESGWDAGLSDFDMVECGTCGSTMCAGHMEGLSDDDKRTMLLSNEYFIEQLEGGADKVQSATGDDLSGLVEEFRAESDWRYGIHELECPVCTLKAISTRSVLGYLMKLYDVTRESLEDEIRSRFTTLGGLRGFIE